MFYSTQLLSKSKGGALGRVWMLAHGQRLPKRAILTSSVVEIVPKILNGPTGSEVFALRVSGILMAGVVIVQNRKSRYLYSDAHDILMRVNSCYATAASVNLRTDHMRNEAITVGPFGAALDVDFLLLGHKALASPAAMVVPGPMGDADGDDDVMLVAMPASESMPLDDLMESQVPHDVRWAARSAEITMPDTIHSMTSGLAQEDTMGFGGDGDVVDMLSNWTNADGTFADYAPESMDVSAADFWATGEGSHPGGPVAQPARKRARRQKKPQQLVIDNVTELAQETYRKWLTDCDDLVTTRPTHRYKGTRKDQYAAALDQVQKDLVPVHMGALWQQWADEGRVGAQEASRVHVSARHAPRDVSVPLDAGFDDGGLEQDLFGTGWSPVGGVDLDLELDDVEQVRFGEDEMTEMTMARATDEILFPACIAASPGQRQLAGKHHDGQPHAAAVVGGKQLVGWSRREPQRTTAGRDGLVRRAARDARCQRLEHCRLWHVRV